MFIGDVIVPGGKLVSHKGIKDIVDLLPYSRVIFSPYGKMDVWNIIIDELDLIITIERRKWEIAVVYSIGYTNTELAMGALLDKKTLKSMIEEIIETREKDLQ